MKYEITSAEIDQARTTYENFIGGGFDAMAKTLSDFLVNRPEPLPTLRPIAEMPAEVPEGCIRVFRGELAVGINRFNSDTHFIDILLPVESEEDKWRAEFEHLVKQVKHEPNLARYKDLHERAYMDEDIADLWSLFKLAKSTPETK